MAVKEEIQRLCNTLGLEQYDLIPHIQESEKWIDELKTFCNRYDFNPRYLAESINDPKVIPMIRGKAFEFSAKEALQKVLNVEQYTVTNPRMNAQTGNHDIDVKIADTLNNVNFSIECKLSGKGSFKTNGTTASSKVKCMRSRTLGPSEIARRAGNNKVLADTLAIHNDQYQAEDFDLVVTSLGNSLYVTDPSDGTFYYSPTALQQEYLTRSGVKDQHDCFNKMYVALAQDLVVNEENGLKHECSRKKCKQQGTNTNCQFIPNYPKIEFGNTLEDVKAPWVPIERVEELLERIRNQ
ncbi:hypothetical protein [Vibrio vulnificus]|uniref:hypothetical protein n=1 Tax=Vibrio vulnificus TaxID=672 RepID=UPI00188D526A|nr:hypothetical protein [Vibrio vulnificus]MBF4449332.1 hypothetical protein [Vibrio vulnificus]MBL6181228.1 hypothetical protein [Vibrio vulnificus]HDY7979739.1 hypothetical protein [Vibrio vulnificus]HDY8003200.1 hypothetical protein [Vibrio vulnificus]HDY8091862.1 hypothetical protein [Vibrio vulnificus]